MVQIGIAIIIIVIILVAVGMYIQKLKGHKPKKLPNNGSGIPAGWSPDATATELHNAMAGAGTDEDAIWNALNGLTPDQCAAVYNRFGELYFAEYGCDLYKWFEDDLSSTDLARAMDYFKTIE